MCFYLTESLGTSFIPGNTFPSSLSSSSSKFGNSGSLGASFPAIPGDLGSMGIPGLWAGGCCGNLGGLSPLAPGGGGWWILNGMSSSSPRLPPFTASSLWANAQPASVRLYLKIICVHFIAQMFCYSKCSKQHIL